MLPKHTKKEQSDINIGSCVLKASGISWLSTDCQPWCPWNVDWGSTEVSMEYRSRLLINTWAWLWMPFCTHDPKYQVTVLVLPNIWPNLGMVNIKSYSFSELQQNKLIWSFHVYMYCVSRKDEPWLGQTHLITSWAYQKHTIRYDSKDHVKFQFFQ